MVQVLCMSLDSVEKSLESGITEEAFLEVVAFAPISKRLSPYHQLELFFLLIIARAEEVISSMNHP